MAEGITGIRLGGLGGQGVVLAGLILGHAAVREGLYASGSSSYGAQSRGSVCKAEVVISSKSIDYPHVGLADFFVAMCQQGYDAYATQITDGGRLFYDAALVSNLGGCRDEKAFDVTSICVKELKEKQAANLIWIGILSRATGLVCEQSLEWAIREHIPARHLDLNLRALRLGLSIWD